MPIALLWTREFLTVVQDRLASLDGRTAMRASSCPSEVLTVEVLTA